MIDRHETNCKIHVCSIRGCFQNADSFNRSWDISLFLNLLIWPSWQKWERGWGRRGKVHKEVRKFVIFTRWEDLNDVFILTITEGHLVSMKGPVTLHYCYIQWKYSIKITNFVGMPVYYLISVVIHIYYTRQDNILQIVKSTVVYIISTVFLQIWTNAMELTNVSLYHTQRQKKCKHHPWPWGYIQDNHKLISFSQESHIHQCDKCCTYVTLSNTSGTNIILQWWSTTGGFRFWYFCLFVSNLCLNGRGWLVPFCRSLVTVTPH